MNRAMSMTCVMLVSAVFLTAGDAYAVKFRFPVVDTERIQFDYVIGCDHDPEPGEYTFNCLPWCAGMEEYPECAASFPYCYDAHDGTDFMLIDGFAMMDMGSADVVAAAAGTVISTADGNYDRCMADLFTQEIDCDGNPMIGNHVKIRHADGMETWYWHFMKDSIVVEVGDEVSCGDVLGKIGSSGYSSGPHLHFEVRTPTGVEGETEWIDPYVGLNSQEESFWVLQRDPTTLLPGCYCEGDEIPDFPEADQDTGGVQDVIVVQDVHQDVYADVPTDVADVVPDVVGDVWQDVPTSDVPFDVDGDVVSWEMWDADTMPDYVSYDLSGDFSGETMFRDMSGTDISAGDVIAAADASADNGSVRDTAGGCSSSGAVPAGPGGLMLLLAAGILALALRRRGTSR